MAEVVVFCLGEDGKVIVYICDGMYGVSLFAATRHRRALVGDTPRALFPPMEKNINVSGNSTTTKPIEEKKNN